MKRKTPKWWATLATVSLVTLLILIGSHVESAIVPPPWSDPEKNPCAVLPGGWQLLYWPPLKKCFKIFQLGYPCPDTMELSPITKRLIKGKRDNEIIAECKCPPGTGQSMITNKCHKIFEKGPCNSGEYFHPIEKHVEPGQNNRWGTCKIPKFCPEGMIFWPKDSKCYNILTRGPCTKGKLLTVNDDGLAECKCERTGELSDHFYHLEETCHEHYTKGPCPGYGKLFLPGGVCGCHPELPHYHKESNQCYEIGGPGPCPLGHIFTMPDNENEIPKYATCQCKEGYVLWSNGNCYRLYTKGPCKDGQFLVNSTTCIQNFCGKGRLYFPSEDTCYRIGSQGPCSLHQVVIFDFTARPSIDGISYNGICGCSGVIKTLDQKCFDSIDETNTCESSPGMVELNGKCYKLYSRGPCGPGQWLEAFKGDNNNENTTSRAKCKCRPGYTSYESSSGVLGCYAPNVGLARYLNNRSSYRSYKFEFPSIIPLIETEAYSSE